jgi:hypothetical protein
MTIHESRLLFEPLKTEKIVVGKNSVGEIMQQITKNLL